MKLISVTVDNFLSWCGHHVVEFHELGSFVAITGRSGSGKSSLFEAITFALYGKSLRGIPKSQLANRTNHKGSRASVIVENGGHVYEVERYASGSKLIVRRDGEELDLGPDNRTVQEFIDSDIVGVSFNDFTKVILVANVKAASFFQMAPAERRKFIDSMFGLERLEVARKAALAERRKISDKKGALITKMDVLNKSLVEAAEGSADFGELGVAIAEAEAKIAEITEKLAKLEETRSAVSSARSEVKAEISPLEYRIRDLRRTLDNMSSLDVCPTCLQKVTESHKESIRKSVCTDIAEISERLSPLNEKAEKMAAKMSDLDGAINKLKNALGQYQTRKYRAEAELAAARKSADVETSNIRKKITELKTEIAKCDKLVAIMNEALKVLGEDGVRAHFYESAMSMVSILATEVLAAMGMNVVINYVDGKEEFVANGVERRYEAFSDGEKSRLNLAMVFAWTDFLQSCLKMSPETMLFDEITINLDPESIDYLRAYMMSRTGCQHVVISHSETLTGSASNTIMVTNNGGCSQLEVA